jgi:hypothetical protein
MEQYDIVAQWQSSRKVGRRSRPLRSCHSQPKAATIEGAVSNLRRYYSEGYIYFLKVATFNRDKILINNIRHFWDSIEQIKALSHFPLTPGLFYLSIFIMCIIIQPNMAILKGPMIGNIPPCMILWIFMILIGL